MNIEQERNRLTQTETLAKLRRNISMADMLTVYLKRSDDASSHYIHCALVPSSHLEEFLANPDWDLMHGGGLPGSVSSWENGVKKVTYLRYGNTEGIEPLVIGGKDYLEISEEFRLFHRLYRNRSKGQYVKVDEVGTEQVVAIVEPNQVKIRLKEIRQFLAIKEMHLSVQFDCQEYSEYMLEELGLVKGAKDQQEGGCCWGLGYGKQEWTGHQSAFSWLMGKRFIEPLPKSKSGFCGFADARKKYVDFIIDVDDNGDEVEYTSAPDSLADFFGANPDAPNYLTPVSFRKQVLDKYYQQPSKYKILDNALWCGNLWMLQIDNHHDDKVCVWLGDLGRNLPHKEQLHWKVYNFASETGVSETYLHRQIDAQPTDSDRSEHVFQQRLGTLKKTCQEQLGWPLLLPLEPDDTYHLQNIRVPANDEQRDFDELVLGLTKILIDSLNEKQLNTLIPHEQRESVKGSISRLEAALSACGVDDADEHIFFLRRLQKLRSTGSAHRKGSSYNRIAQEFGVDSQDLRAVFTGILQKAIVCLDYLIQLVKSNRFLQPRRSG